MTNKKLVESLVRIANRLDCAKMHDLADSIDDIIRAAAGLDGTIADTLGDIRSALGEGEVLSVEREFAEDKDSKLISVWVKVGWHDFYKSFQDLPHNELNIKVRKEFEELGFIFDTGNKCHLERSDGVIIFYDTFVPFANGLISFYRNGASENLEQEAEEIKEILS